MASTFFGLTIAYSGLTAANAAVNTTANNIANAQTEGYSRQVVTQQASDALRVFETYGCAGAGVETIAIERMRDDFYDVKMWNNNEKIGEYEVKNYYMTQLENYYLDNDYVTGFNSIFEQLMIEDLQEFLKNPSDISTLTQFIGSAESLTDYFNNLYGNLEALQQDINEEIKIQVDKINSIAAEISTLNQQINVIEMSGGTANELRDRRTLLIDELSLIVDVEISETPIIDPNNPDMETGATRYIVRIAGGQTLVDGNDYNGLYCQARESYDNTNLTDADGLYDVYWANGQEFNLNNGSLGGTLAGLVQMRDGNNGEYFNGTITGIGTTGNSEGVTQDTVTIQVDDAYLQDLNKSNLAGEGELNLGNQLFYYESWEFNITYDDDGNAQYFYTFTLDGDLNDRTITNDRVGKDASIGASIDYQGIPYYMSQMNEWVRTFSQKVNEVLNSGYDSYGDAGNNLFVADTMTSSEQYNFTDNEYFNYTYEDYLEQVDNGDTSGFTVSNTDVSYYKLTAENFAVLDAMLKDASLLATQIDPSEGVENTELLQNLKDMMYDKDQASFRGGNMSEFLQCMLTDIALNASSASTFYSNYSNIGLSIDTQRISVSGVDEDEEAINLVKYQNAFNLSSKMIQVLTEMYDKLILDTGV